MALVKALGHRLLLCKWSCVQSKFILLRHVLKMKGAALHRAAGERVEGWLRAVADYDSADWGEWL
jgi:hypothetical protein